MRLTQLVARKGIIGVQSFARKSEDEIGDKREKQEGIYTPVTQKGRRIMSMSVRDDKCVQIPNVDVLQELNAFLNSDITNYFFISLITYATSRGVAAQRIVAT